MVMFAPSGPKDSQRNAEVTGEFVANLATWDLREQMNTTSATVGPEVSEADLAGLEMVPSRLVKPPRVAAAAAALECRWVKSVPLTTAAGEPMPGAIVIGEVVSIHIDDAVIVDGRIDLSARRAISRLGYMEYGVLDTVFSMQRPR